MIAYLYLKGQVDTIFMALIYELYISMEAFELPNISYN
jgi:hypothetical protein